MARARRRLLGVALAAVASAASADMNDPRGFGAHVRALGDLNGDGVPDFAVVTGGEDPSVFVYSGRDGRRAWKSEGGSYDIAAIGDWNKDGKPDVVIGMPGTVQIGRETGWLQVLDGKSGKHLGMIEPAKPAAGPMGLRPNTVAVTVCGDLNGDAKPDLLVVRAAPAVRPGGAPDGSRWCDKPAVFAVSTDGKIIAELRSFVCVTRRSLIAEPAGDADGDGLADVFVTSYAGADAVCLRLTSPTKGDVAGFMCEQKRLTDCVAVLGDANGDGSPDYVFGAAATGADGAGEVWIASGKDGKTLRKFQGAAKDEHFGKSVAALGDVDGDGVPDIAVGVPGCSTGKQEQHVGAVRAISGKSGKSLWTVPGTMAGAELGTTMTGVGDVDGDGIGDLVAGAPLGPVGCYALLVSGKLGTVIATVE